MVSISGIWMDSFHSEVPMAKRKLLSYFQFAEVKETTKLKLKFFDENVQLPSKRRQ